MDSFALNSSLLDWEWSSCPETLALFIHILFRASDKERRWQGILIPKGGFVTTIPELAKHSGLTYKQVRTSLKRLASSGDIALDRAHRCTLITLCESAIYDCKNCNEGRVRADRGQSEGRVNIATTSYESETCEGELFDGGRERADNSENCDSPIYSLINNNHSYSEIENKKKERVSKDTPKKEQQETEIAATLKPPSPAAKSPPYNLDFVSAELLQDFQDFLDMRKKIRKPLKTQTGVKTRYNRLMTLSDGDTELARKIIRQSIGNEWQDFYQLKTQDQNNGKNNIAVNLRSEKDFSDRHYDTTLPDWDSPGGDSDIDEELLP